MLPHSISTAIVIPIADLLTVPCNSPNLSPAAGTGGAGGGGYPNGTAAATTRGGGGSGSSGSSGGSGAGGFIGATAPITAASCILTGLLVVASITLFFLQVKR